MSKPIDFSSICVIIPTINESTLEEVVAEVARQTCGAQIMVAGFGSAESVAAKFSEHGAEFVNFGQRTIKSKMLNRCVEASDRDRLIILDADAVPCPGWAAGMLRAFEEGHSLFSASVTTGQENIWMKTYNISLLHEFFQERPSGPRLHLPTISAGFTRLVYHSVGPFLGEHYRCDDYEWTLNCSKHGFTPQFIAEVAVLHKPVEKDSLVKLLLYWYNSGGDNLAVRLKYSDLLRTPALFRNKWAILFFSPLLSIVPTFRIYQTIPKTMATYFYLTPIIFLTKLTWCVGAFMADSTARNHAK